MRDEIVEEETKFIMEIIQKLLKYLYHIGIDENGVHNIVEIAKRRAYDEVYVEQLK